MHAAPPPLPTDVDAALALSAREVEEYLARWLSRRALPESLREALRYALLAGGKRVRPALTLAWAEACGGTRERALPSAAALELVHNFSLVHDDLPALDNDDLRRGRATLHRHAGEALAILAGDALLGLAFELVSEDQGDPALAAALTGELARATNDMIAGQVLDTLGDAEPAEPSLQRLRRLHALKTGALLACACRCGARAAAAPAELLNAASRYGEALGLMFQMVDDWIDVTQTAEHAGKGTHKDAGRNKLTYPGLIGVAATRQAIDGERARARLALEPLGPRAALLDALCDWLARRTR